MFIELDEDKSDSTKARASIYDKLECSVPALKDYKRYLKLNPNGRDVPFIRGRIMILAEQSRHIS